MLSIPDRTLTHGTTGEPITIPQLGYGVFQVPDPQTEEVTAAALGDRLPPHRHGRDLRK